MLNNIGTSVHVCCNFLLCLRLMLPAVTFLFTRLLIFASLDETATSLFTSVVECTCKANSNSVFN